LKDFLLYQIMKKLQKGKNVKSRSQDKNKKVIEKKRKRDDNSDNDDDNSDEEKENETSTISNSVPRSVNLNKNVNNNKKKKLLNNDDKEDDIDIDIEKKKEDNKSEDEKEGEEENNEENNEIVENEDDKGKNNIHEGFKIKRIKSMMIPKDKNEGIKFNIMYEKGGKTFIDIFDAKNEEIPSEYLIEYYEKFICDNNKGFQYNEEMVFHD